jgi:hypothetical protein
MLMAMLQAGGVEVVTDGIRQPDEDNPRAYLEVERVKNLHKEADPRWLRVARGKAIKVISYLLPYLPDRYDYTVLFMRRDLSEVLASQARMLERRGERHDVEPSTMLRMFEEHLNTTKRLLDVSHFSALDVPYATVVNDPAREAARVADFLRTHGHTSPLDTARMAAAVEPALYRNRAAATNV